MEKVKLDKEFEIFQKVKSNKEHFDLIYKLFAGDTYRFAYSILGNKQDAEDITSQAFLEFYKSFEKYEWKGITMKSWLFTTIRNLSYKRFRIKESTTIENENELPNIDEPHFVDQVIEKDLVEIIKTEINKLDSLERQVLNLRIWEDLSYKEIGEICNVTPDSARMRFNRSIVKIQSSLAKSSSKTKAFITLPILFTAIAKVGSLQAASAATGGVLSTIAGALTTQTMLTTTILSAKTIIAAFTATAVVSTGGYMVYQANHNSPKPPVEQAVLTPIATNTPIPTNTPTPTIVAQPPATTPMSLVTYTDKEGAMLQFEHPQGYSVKTVIEETTSTELYKKFYISKNDTDKLVIYFYASGGFGCMIEEGTINKTDIVFKNTSTGENIARSRGEDGTGLPSYFRYSSDTNNQGYMESCGTTTFTTKKYPKFNDESGNMLIKIETTKPNQDWSEFDKIVASIKRL